MSRLFENEAALFTDAFSGIGRSAAREFASAGPMCGRLAFAFNNGGIFADQSATADAGGETFDCTFRLTLHPPSP